MNKNNNINNNQNIQQTIINNYKIRLNNLKRRIIILTFKFNKKKNKYKIQLNRIINKQNKYNNNQKTVNRSKNNKIMIIYNIQNKYRKRSNI